MVEPWLLAMTHVWGAEEEGVDIRTQCEVLECRRDGGRWNVVTSLGLVTAQTVVNCGGNYGDRVDTLGGMEPKFTIRPGKGEYIVFDCKSDGSPWVTRPIVPVPNKKTAGLYIFP